MNKLGRGKSKRPDPFDLTQIGGEAVHLTPKLGQPGVGVLPGGDPSRFRAGLLTNDKQHAKSWGQPSIAGKMVAVCRSRTLGNARRYWIGASSTTNPQ